MTKTITDKELERILNNRFIEALNYSDLYDMSEEEADSYLMNNEETDEEYLNNIYGF